MTGDPEYLSEEEELALARQVASEERARRAEQGDEADRRARVRRTLARQDLYSLLEPASAAMDQDENALTERLLPGMTLETALAAEVVTLAARGLLPITVSASAIARRLFGAYDEESAGRVRDLPTELLTAERVYAHLTSLSGLEKLPVLALTTLARRATILLYNRRWLAPGLGGVAPLSQSERAAVRDRFATTHQQIRAEVESGERPGFTLGEINAEIQATRADRKPVPAPDQEDSFCVDCGRGLLPGESCSCSKTVSLPEPVPDPAPKPAPPLKPLRRDKPYADRTLVLNPHGLRDPDAQPAVEPEDHEQTRRAAEPRVVEGYLRVTTDLSFATDLSREQREPGAITDRGADVILRAGTVVEQMEPSRMDLADIEKKQEQGIQLVTIRWMGKIRLVHGSSLVPASRAEWADQDRASKEGLTRE